MIDFDSLNELTISDISGTTDRVASITAVNEDEAIAALFSYSDGNKHTFYRYNFTSDSFTWAVDADSICK